MAGKIQRSIQNEIDYIQHSHEKGINKANKEKGINKANICEFVSEICEFLFEKKVYLYIQKK